MCSPCSTDNYVLIEEKLTCMKNWKCEMPFNESMPNDPPNEIDLCAMMKGNKPYIFPQRFTGITSKDKLITELKISGMKAGFALIIRSTTQRATKYYLQTCHLYCQHGAVFRNRTKKNVRVSNSKWCVVGNDQCKFRLIIGLKKDSDRWVLKNCDRDDKSSADIHIGHFKMNIEHIHTGIGLLSKDEIALSKDCAQLNISVSATTELLNIRNFLGIDNKWKTSQVYYKLNKCETLSNDASSAQRLISTFENRNDVNYLYITYEASEGLLLFTGERFIIII